MSKVRNTPLYDQPRLLVFFLSWCRKSGRNCLASLLAFGMICGAGLPAYAESCLLDTNNDGNADTNVDTTGGAVSVGLDDRLACGVDAAASHQNSTAIGNKASATGPGNTTLGYEADALNPLTNATAIGALAQVEQDNAMVLGSIPGLNEGTSFVDVGIGTSTPVTPLHIHRNTKDLLAMLRLSNHGGSSIEFSKISTFSTWRLVHEHGGTGDFQIDHTGILGADGAELSIASNGDVKIQGTLAVASDKNAKQRISELDGNLIMAKLEQLPIAEWSYKSDAETRHIGPMAQDFHQAFGLGKSDKHISPTDMAGVNMAAIKTQQSKLKAFIADHERAMAEKDAEIAALVERLSRIEARLASE